MLNVSVFISHGNRVTRLLLADRGISGFALQYVGYRSPYFGKFLGDFGGVGWRKFRISGSCGVFLDEEFGGWLRGWCFLFGEGTFFLIGSVGASAIVIQEEKEGSG